MIQAFPREPTVTAGESLWLHVSTDAAAFRVEFHRCGDGLHHAGSSEWLEGRHAPPHLPHQDWSCDNVGLGGRELPAWPAHRFPIPAGWRPGVYVAVLREGPDDARPRAVSGDARQARALFVLRGSAAGRHGRILYKLPLFTYHAYNQVCAEHWAADRPDGGWCLYSDFDPLPVGLPLSVSYRRPGGGTGGTPYDGANGDPFDPTPRQTFVHWDARVVAWLERSGYAVELCTDLDLHRDAGTGSLLEPYALLVSAGHDEYWSAEMRDAVEGWVRRGGNAAFFGANTAWWRIAFESGGTAFRRAGHWAAAGRPENAMTGVSFRNGGERPLGAPGRPVGFRVQHADHWVYEGSGVLEGECFGDGADEHLVGYECDGAAFDRRTLLGEREVVPAGSDGTPSDFLVLGVGDVAAAGWGLGNAAATLGLHAPGGTVFTAATTDWPRLLHPEPNPVVQRVTHNVVERLARRGTAVPSSSDEQASLPARRR
jgi:hypothetical protein